MSNWKLINKTYIYDGSFDGLLSTVFKCYQEKTLPQKLYPKKAGKIELHHPIPKYIGGAKDQALVPLDAAYHQLITNEFRTLWHYGKGIINDLELRQDIIKQVYNKYPLPPTFKNKL